jgi:hypothetical protein
VILAISITAYGNVCLSKDQEPVAMLDEQVSQLEELWKAGRSDEYYAKAAKIASDVNAVSGASATERNRILTHLFEGLLAKAKEKPRTSTDDLFTMQKVARYLLFNVEAPPKECQANVRLLSSYLGEMRQAIVPNFKRRPVEMNVAPPPGAKQFTMAGMDPEAIHDPNIRAQYKAAIDKNRENNLMNTRQFVLRNLDREMCGPILDYMVRVLQLPPRSSTLADECIKHARLTAEERKKVEIAIGAAQEHSDK